MSRPMAILLALLLFMPAMAGGEGAVMEVAPIVESNAEPSAQQGGGTGDEMVIVVGETQRQTTNNPSPSASGSETVSTDVQPAPDQGTDGVVLAHLYYFTIDGELFDTQRMQPGASSVMLEATPPLEGHTFLFWYDYFAEEIAPFVFDTPVYEDVWLVPYYLNLAALGIDASEGEALENPAVQSIQEAIQGITDLGVEEPDFAELQAPQERASVISSEQDSLLIDEILSNLPSEDKIQQTPMLPDDMDAQMTEPESLPEEEEETLTEAETPEAEETLPEEGTQAPEETLELAGELDVDAFGADLNAFVTQDPASEPEDHDYSTSLSDTVVEILGKNQSSAEAGDEEEEADGGSLDPETEAPTETEESAPVEAAAEAEEPSLVVESVGPEKADESRSALDVDGTEVAIQLFATAEGDAFAPGTEILVGDTVYLKGDIDNLQNHAFSLRWQVNTGSGWETIQGVDGDTYALTITDENVTWNYRLQMIVSVELEAGAEGVEAVGMEASGPPEEILP